MKTAPTPTQPVVLFVGFPHQTQVLIQTHLGNGIGSDFIDWQQDINNKITEQAWYKVVFFINPVDFAEIGTKIQNLVLTRVKVVVFLPLLVGFKTEQSDQEHRVLGVWKKLLSQQKRGITQIVNQFSSARLVFFDGLSLVGLPTSLPHLLFSQSGAGVVFDITPANQTLSIIFEEDFSQVVVDFVKQPHRAENIIVRSQAQGVNYVVRHLINIYQQLYQKTLAPTRLIIELINDLELDSNVLTIGKKDGKLSYSRLYDGGFFKTAVLLDQSGLKNKLEEGQKASLGKKNIGFEPNLHKIFSSSRTKQKKGFINTVVQAEKKFSKKNTSQKIFFAGGVISALVAVYIMFLAGKFYFSYQAFYAEAKKATTNALVQKQVESSVWDDLSNKNQQMAGVINSWGNLVSHPILDQAELLNTGLIQLGEYLDLLTQHRAKQELVWQYILTQNQDDFFQLTEELNRVESELGGIEDELSLSLDQLGFFSEESIVYDGFIKDIESRKKSNSLFQLFYPHLSELLGFTGQKNYILLFQDSAELRPGGGFISAAAVIRIKDGQIISFLSWPSHELSRMVGGNVSPPPELEQLLNEKNWFFHDSNWGADYPTTAKTIAWFIEKAVGFAPDGVIGLTNQSLEELLDELDGAELSSLNEKINQDNLVDKQAFYSEKGVVELQNFSSALLAGIIEKSFSQTPQGFADLLTKVVNQLDSGSTQVWIKNPELEQTVAAVGWSGAIVPTGCLSQFTTNNCVGDYIYQVEANVGINRVNQLVKSKIEDSIALESDRVNRIRKVSWENIATTNLWPSGPYKAYVRWYLPKEAYFGDLLVNGRSIVGDGVRLYSEHDKSVVASIIEVPVGQKTEVELSYFVNFTWVDSVSYMLNNQLQSGRESDGYQVFFSFPKDRGINKITPQPSFQADGEINFAFESEGDKIIGVSFE